MLATLRYFLRLSLGLSAVLAVVGAIAGPLSGHGVLKGIVWALWIGGGVLLLFGGSAGSTRGSGVAARQTAGRRLLPNQIDPVGMILLGLVPLGIGVALAVLFVY